MSHLPHALVIGPMKAGTTWIQDYVRYRQDVCLPQRVKETFFFDRYWKRGVEWYASHFKHCHDKKYALTLEVASSYFHHPEAPERVKQALGSIPLLVTLRDPVQRAWSHYMHLKRYGHTKHPIQKAAQEFPELLQASRYRACLQWWYEHFPLENIHFLWQDLLASSPDDYAFRICQVLNLEYRPVPQSFRKPSYEAAVPKSRLLAKLGNRSSYLLRGLGLYSMINIGKRMGLHSLFFGRPGSAKDIQPSSNEMEWLLNQLSETIPPEAEEAYRSQIY